MSSFRNALTLASGEAHVWLARPEQVSSPALRIACENVLSEEENLRRCRFRFERHRHHFLVAHALVRDTLSRYSELRPNEWVFHNNAYGRPEIANRASDLHFNLSHTDGLVACAVSRHSEIGVDVEASARTVDVRVADRYFSAPENRALLTLPASQRQSRFLQYWTLKESYIKARGMGLALPLDGFAFSIAEGRAPDIEFLSGISDRAERWQFQLLETTPGFVLAVCLEVLDGQHAPDAKMKLKVRETVPLVDLEG